MSQEHSFIIIHFVDKGLDMWLKLNSPADLRRQYFVKVLKVFIVNF